MDPIANTIAITTGVLGLAGGVVLLMPSIMAFDAGADTKPSMILLGCSGMSVIPVSIIATVMTISTGDLKYQYLYAVPILGIGTSFVLDGIFNKAESQQPPPTGPPLAFPIPPATAPI